MNLVYLDTLYLAYKLLNLFTDIRIDIWMDRKIDGWIDSQKDR